MRVFLFVLLQCILATSVASAQETIDWLYDDFPPYMFTEGTFSGKGVCGAAMLEFQVKEKNFNYSMQHNSFNRYLKLMKSQDNKCYSCLLKNSEREEYILFSKPYTYLAGNELITRVEDEDIYRPYLEDDGSIDLEKLLESGEIILSITHGRSFGEKIDAILAPYKETPVINSSSGKSSLETMIRRLFSLKAFHAILGYPPEIVWHSHQLDIPLEQFKMYPIKGRKTFEPNSYVYFGCSKSETGEKVIDAINANMGDIRHTANETYRRWLDEDTRRLHVKSEQEFLKENP